MRQSHQYNCRNESSFYQRKDKRVEGNDGLLAVKLEEGHITVVRMFGVINH